MKVTVPVPGVARLAHAYVSCYVLADDDGATVVDAGLPRMWGMLPRALAAVDRRLADVRAVVLTHAHFDHVGFARRAREELDVAVWVHDADARLAAHPYRYAHENPRATYPLRHPRAVPILGAMLAAGAARVHGVENVRRLVPGGRLEIPGRPVVVACPGHTDGHVALHLPDRDTLLSGDALVTLDPYTGRTGPRIVAGAATADSALNLASLDALAATGARVVLPGHGEPWTGGVVEAVRRARAVGAA
ncbi:MBL fold metallo-hydrolase [Cellulomonas dongxiuzhuiae]|uniref:MBL fold metallo-hydrolase n=1 Tax=Cellulomonas dongxiuzhuiae TaxID=2819979 RepID=UPI001AAF8B2C|nr:MBL fold metallo-hydrolase [Cellulomonas dongxiuzhuiae]MBO3089891.1 MBL fold metallo-hydrolase [Cellulomonas dongxiuzhuiae]